MEGNQATPAEALSGPGRRVAGWRAARARPGAEMTVTEHLEELRYRVLVSLLALVAGGIVAWRVVPHAIALLAEASGRLVVTSPGEAFAGYLKLLLVVDLLLAGPVLLAQAWLYVVPALYPHELALAWRVVPVAVVLFIGGAAFGYLVLYPVALRFLMTQAGPGVVPAITFNRLLTFLLGLTVPLGVLFELPLASYVAARLGFLSPDALRRQRRWAVMGAFTLSAVVTPTVDPVTQTLTAGPLVVLYELAIRAAAWGSRSRQRAAAAAEEA